MDKTIIPLLFSILMILFGCIAIFFPDGIRSVAIKLIGIQQQSSGGLLHSPHAMPSIRFGGVLAVCIGLFMLWVAWK